jgi:hypothetical protein
MRKLGISLCALMVLLLGVTPRASAQPYTVTTVIESGNGKIRPTSPTVKQGKRKTFTVKPGDGWHVAAITLDGATVFDKDDSLALAGVMVKGRTVTYTLAGVSADHIVAATFEENRTYNLTVSVEGGGTVKVRPGSMTCAADTPGCAAAYTEDATVQLRAKPARGYLFAGWSGGTSGMRRQGKLAMNGDKVVGARFELESAPVAPLRVAEKVSVVDAKSGAAPALRTGAAAVPPGSDYERDKTFTFVEEHSVGAFETINEILCMAAQTKYEAMLNRGPYKALVDRNQCEADKDDASGAEGESSQSSGAAAPSYMQWTVDSSRRDNASPHIVTVWVREGGEEGERHHEPAKLIFAKLVITESASADNPYGIFTLNFEAHPLEPGLPAARVNGEEFDGEPIFKGFMRTERSLAGDVLLQFISSGGGGSESSTEKATLSRYAAGGRGTTSVHFEFEGQVEDATFDIAFSDDHFLRDDGAERQCLDRNDFDETAWRYGLYDAETGSRVSPRSGFPVKAIIDGRQHYGWIGYWGTWFPEDVSLETGATVYRLGYGDQEGTPYEVFRAGGKLRRHTRVDLTLAGIKNVPLEYWDDTQQHRYRIIWDGASFQKVARFDDATGMWDALEPAETLSLSSVRSDRMSLWSQALGGNVRVRLACTSNEPAGPETPPTFSCAAHDSSPVVLYADSIIYPSDVVPTTLACMNRCPNGANDASGGLFFDDAALHYQETPPGSASYIAYAFDAAGMLLVKSGTPIVQTVENAFHPWGVRSGPLFEPTAANLARLACEWDATGQSTCGWQAWDTLDEYYTWETGPNEWNTFTGLENADGEIERFEPPLAVRYVHAQSDPEAQDHKYNGATFYLEYSGFGDLHGIPGKCVDRATGTDVSCGPNTRWVPEFTVPDGSEVAGEAQTYLCKALEKEQRMRSVPLEECTGLRLVSYELPRIADWRPPDIGAEPVVTDPPAVVGGVIQDEEPLPAPL